MKGYCARGPIKIHGSLEHPTLPVVRHAYERSDLLADPNTNF
jgi:hypothetical protein